MPQITRWIIFLAAYKYQLIHGSGKSLGHTDTLSQCPLPEIMEDPIPIAPMLLIENFASGSITSAEIARHSPKDRTLAQVLNWVGRGWPKEPTPPLKPFYIRQHELSAIKGCLLWGDWAIVPPKLWKPVLEVLHMGHPTIFRMKPLARSYV